MKRIFLTLVIIPGLVHAQRWHVNLTGGMSNYSGDLQDKTYTFDESNFAFGAGAQYDITHNFSVIGGFNVMKLSASDKFNKPDLQPRNLSFQTSVLELDLLAEYTFLDITRYKFSPYVFGGIAWFHYDPYAFDSLGQKIFLEPLSTEGEGLPEYPGQKPYNLNQFAIPFGGGIKFRVSENVVLAWELGFRKTFTDYLDDVSTSYVDQTILQNAKGQLATEMAYRGNELKGGAPYPPAGTKRGSPKYKDWYYFTGIRVSIAIINKKDGFYGRGSTACPGNVQ